MKHVMWPFLLLSLLVCSGCGILYNVKVDDREVMQHYRNATDATPVATYVFGCDRKDFKLHISKDKQVYFSCVDAYEGSPLWKLYKAGPGPETDEQYFFAKHNGAREFKRVIAPFATYSFNTCGSNRYCVTVPEKRFSQFILSTRQRDNNLEYLDFSKTLAAMEGFYQQLSGATTAGATLLSPDAVKSLLEQDRAVRAITAIASKSAWQASKEIASKNSLLDIPYIGEAYNKRYLELDYSDAFAKSDSLDTLKAFVANYEGNYDPDKLVAKAITKLIPLLRKSGTFEDLCLAYRFTKERQDFESARTVMQGESAQKQAKELFAEIYQQELENARVSIPALQKFMASYPESGLADKSRQLINGLEGDKAWKNRYAGKHDAPSMKKFVTNYPHSLYLEEANKRIRRSELAVAKNKGTAALRGFIQAHTGSDEALQATQYIEKQKHAELAKARRGGIKGLLNYAATYRGTPEVATIQQEIDAYIKKEVAVTASDVIAAPGDGKSAWQWGMESNRDFIRTGDKYNIFIVGTVKNKSRELLPVRVQPTLHLLRTTVARMVFSTTKTTPVDLDANYYLTLRPGEEKPFIVMYQNISAGGAIGSGMIGGSPLASMADTGVG